MTKFLWFSLLPVVLTAPSSSLKGLGSSGIATSTANVSSGTTLAQSSIVSSTSVFCSIWYTSIIVLPGYKLGFIRRNKRRDPKFLCHRTDYTTASRSYDLCSIPSAVGSAGS
ncbi:hypothetical protein NP233_g11627 [Leucocoprinus birnbaumii]|uniref:Secreted protein n=1 Tax=Leucocoprinus birnbaumii TaxID=56174 RepID=A0AAD5VGT3_9AGAR|nr:hypothetical protein NP233_g11627 [Leucocoprinus birnbaumii]